MNRLLTKGLTPEPRGAEELLEGLESLAGKRVAENEWQDWVIRITEDLRQGDPASFLRLPSIRTTVHTNEVGLSARYLAFLRKRPLWRERLCKACVESPFGNPFVDPTYPRASPLLIQHCYHLCRILEFTRLQPTDFSDVFEFGAGYGSFVRLLRNLGASPTHWIYDLPHMILIQKFYLENVFADRIHTDPGFLDTVHWLSGDPGDPDVSAELEKIEPSGFSLFLATFSLSEAPVELRERFRHVISRFGFVCIAFAARWGGVDNLSFFDRYTKALDTHSWTITECPVHRGKYYAMGKLRA